MAEAPAPENVDRLPCTVCGLLFKPRGLKIHANRCHGIKKQTQQKLEISDNNIGQDLQDQTPSAMLGEQLAELKTTMPTLRRVPKGARLATAHALTAVIDEVTTTNNESSWKKLLLFPYAILEVPQKCDNVKNLTKWVKEKADLWSLGPFIPSPRKRVYATSVKHCLGTSPDLTKKIEAKLSDGDIRGAVRLASTDDTIATDSEETFLVLQDKHPTHDPPLVPSDTPPMLPYPPVTEQEVTEAIRSFRPGSAGGLDGLRPQIIKDLTSKQLGQAATHLQEAIRKLVILLLNGNVPSNIAPILFGASLTALQKKDGGIRPVAVGMVWRRLASKVVVSRISPSVVELVSPHQLGVGVKGGAEGGAHVARRYWNMPHSCPKLFLKLDFKNAFNELRRDTMLHAVQMHFPLYYKYIHSCYAQPSLLFYGRKPILSQRGIQQGDPLGPALFSITVQPTIESIQTELNLWYLDDGTIADEPDVVLRDFEVVRNLSKDMGLQLNEAKCEVGILGTSSKDDHENVLAKVLEVAPSIRVLQENEVTLLGAPISDAAIVPVVEAKTSVLAQMSERLSTLSSHTAFFLLRASMATPRLIYFLRCAPTWRCYPALQRYDSTLRETLEIILNCSLTEEAWKQSSLPVRNGGLGVRQATNTAIPCFLASSHGTRHLVNRAFPMMTQSDPAEEEGISLWVARYNQEPPLYDTRHKQEVWEEPHILHTVRHLSETSESPQDKARLLAIQQPDAGAWLSAIPSPQLGTHLVNEAFRVCCSLRLGCNVCQPHQCPCGEMVSSKGLHGLNCKFSAGRRSRHERVNDIVSRALRSAEIPNIREPAGCCRADGKRPDGMTLIPWARGRPVVWDFTCTDTLAPSYIGDTTSVPGAAAERAEARKYNKYRFLTDKFLFMPMAIETFGVWGSQCRSFIEELSSRLQEVTGDRRGSVFLKQRISLAVQQGNVASVLGTLPPGKVLDDIFFY